MSNYHSQYYQSHKKDFKEYNQQYYQLHKDKIKEYQAKLRQINPEYCKKWRIENPEKAYQSVMKWRQNNIERYNQYQRQYWSEHIDMRNEHCRRYQKKRSANDIFFHLNKIIRTSIATALKGKKAGRHWETLVGYTLNDLMKHLENQFKSWMSWKNYGKWEIDHIKPKSLFYYTSAEDPEFRKCWALKNLQPLEKIANIKKSNHYLIQ